MVNPMTLPSLIECIACDYAESHSRMLGHTYRQTLGDTCVHCTVSDY